MMMTGTGCWEEILIYMQFRRMNMSLGQYLDAATNEKWVVESSCILVATVAKIRAKDSGSGAF